MADFSPGDTVELKSGSPMMTVKKYNWDPQEGVREKDKLVCVWFDEEDQLQSGTFPASTLRPVDPDQIAGM